MEAYQDHLHRGQGDLSVPVGLARTPVGLAPNRAEDKRTLGCRIPATLRAREARFIANIYSLANMVTYSDI